MHNTTDFIPRSRETWASAPMWFKLDPVQTTRRLLALSQGARAPWFLIYLELWLRGGRAQKEGTNWANIARVSRRTWKKIESEVFGAFDDHAGSISAPDLLDQRREMDRKRDQKRLAGEQSGLSRALQPRRAYG